MGTNVAYRKHGAHFPQSLGVGELRAHGTDKGGRFLAPLHVYAHLINPELNYAITGMHTRSLIVLLYHWTTLLEFL
jgi:hypothetical protein